MPVLKLKQPLQAWSNANDQKINVAVVYCLHVHKVDRTSRLQEWPWLEDEDTPCGNQHHSDHTAESTQKCISLQLTYD